jgi:sporulation protein YlmC with PRC-barrel domain
MSKFLKREKVLGKEVIDEEGMKIGIVKDLAFSVDGKIAFVVEKPNKREVKFDIESINKIGDVILVKPREAKVTEKLRSKPHVGEITIICPNPNCQYKNPPGRKYCEKCGIRLT